MKTMALAICAALAAPPAIGQVADNDAAAEVIDNLLDGVRILRCDDEKTPLYLPFTIEADGQRVLPPWYFDAEVSSLAGYTTITQKDRVLIVSEERMIVVRDDAVKEFSCRFESFEIKSLLGDLRRNR